MIHYLQMGDWASGFQNSTVSLEKKKKTNHAFSILSKKNSCSGAGYIFGVGFLVGWFVFFLIKYVWVS